MIMPTSPTREPLLIGRQRELAVLWSQFEIAVRGQLRVALVAGEPGIGKTHLLEALAARAARQGALMLRGGASEAEGMPPFLPFWKPSARTFARLPTMYSASRPALWHLL